MSVSFGLRTKRQKLGGSAVTQSFVEAQIASDAAAPNLTAEEALEESLRQQEDGSTSAEDRNFSRALRSWNRAIALTPDRAVLHELKAQALLELDHVWQAVQCAGRAAELAPAWPDGHLTLGRAQLELGEPELALESMEEVLRLQPAHLEARQEIDAIRVLVKQRQQDHPEGGQRLAVTASSRAEQLI